MVENKIHGWVDDIVLDDDTSSFSWSLETGREKQDFQVNEKNAIMITMIIMIRKWYKNTKSKHCCLLRNKH